jgi:hypothetical protein
MPSSRAARRARRKAAAPPRDGQPAFRPRNDGTPDGDVAEDDALNGDLADDDALNGDLADDDDADDGDVAAGMAAARPAPASSGGRPDPGSAAPVILLTYAYAGGGHVQELLDRDPSLVCTAGTGILATCHQAAMTWRLIEGLDGDAPLTRLALASVRALATGMLTTITSRIGGPRWCETVTVEPDSAQTLLELFPATRFICVQRACPDVIFEITRASPWGLADRGFAAYTVTHPASTVAALAAWWADYAGALLGFEQAHPESCLRVRYEDLVAEPDATTAAIHAFLWLDRGPAMAGLATPGGQPAPGRAGLGAPGCGAQMPAGQLQPQLTARVNAIHELLGYPPLPAATPGGQAAPPAAANSPQTIGGSG